jgi:hypothetical protein
LSVGDQHALIGDDEHVGGREFLVAGVEVLVGVDVVRHFDRARKVGELQPALDGVGGANDGLRRCTDGGDDDKCNDRGHETHVGLLREPDHQC